MSDAALSVLVLAWDETAPTLRTVVDAAPAVGSLLVLLPPQPPTPTQAEAPASANAAPANTMAASPPAGLEPTAPEPTTAELTAPETVASALPPTAPPRALAPAETPVAATPPMSSAPVSPAATRPAAAAAQALQPAVRLLRLADNPLALLEHTGSFRVPAAPYLGATPTVPGQAEPAGQVAPATRPTAALVPQQELATLEPGAASPLELAPTELTEPLGPAAAAEPAAAASAPEATDLAPQATGSEAPAEAAPETTGQEEIPTLADAAFRAEEILDADPMQELQAAPLEAPAATPADSPMLRDALPPAHGPFGLRIPERLPVLDDPAPPPARVPTPNEDEPLPDEPASAIAPYSAPDLNMQVIRYARQAVQAALAEGAFGTIYAPAWPTWLAALELRQRSGRPLVLHLAALAAGRQSADTAAGWPAEIQRQALRQADLVLVETYSLARRLRRELGLDTKVVRVVPAGDTAAIARALRRARRA